MQVCLFTHKTLFVIVNYCRKIIDPVQFNATAARDPRFLQVPETGSDPDPKLPQLSILEYLPRPFNDQ